MKPRKILASLALLSLLVATSPAPALAVATSTATSTQKAATSTSKTPQYTSNARSDSSSKSNSWGSLLGVVGAIGIMYGLQAILAPAVTTVASNAASQLLGQPSGGRVTPPIFYCNDGSELFYLVGPRYNGPVMWTLKNASNRYLTTAGAPPVINQCILFMLDLTDVRTCTVGTVTVGGGPTISIVPGYGTSIPACAFGL